MRESGGREGTEAQAEMSSVAAGEDDGRLQERFSSCSPGTGAPLAAQDQSGLGKYTNRVSGD